MGNVWNQSTIVYHIYLRSFKDSNSDGIGDIEGLIQKLNYLNGDKDCLGIDAVWLSPIYPSPQKDFGYDISDHKNVDPIYGNLEIFKRFVSEAHNRGIKVMMDFVPNHTSFLHPWFLESRFSKSGTKRDYYIWADPKEDGSPPNNWLSLFGGSGWEYDDKTGQYYFHSFDVSQPDLNLRNPKVIKELLDVLDFWLKLGVDGFRVDAVEHMFKDPNLHDEPVNPVLDSEIQRPYDRLVHIYTFGLPEVIEVLKTFVEKVEEYAGKFVVTESWSEMEEIVKLYPQIDRKWFTPFNFGLIVQPWKAKRHKEFIDSYDESVGVLYAPTYVLGNHDKPRVVSRIGPAQARIAAILLLTLRGMPYVYYGDEIGMEDLTVPEDKAYDPYGQNSPGLGLGRDPERSPMQWGGEKHAGFCSGCDPWLPVSENFNQVNVDFESKDPHSMLALYRQLIELKKTSNALQFGKYQSFTVESEEVFVYTRSYEDEVFLIILNYSLQKQKISLPFNKGKIILDSGLNKHGQEIKLDVLNLSPNEGLVLQIAG